MNGSRRVAVSTVVLFALAAGACYSAPPPAPRAVIDAGLVRLRPVLVTVLATVGGLIPLALEGGPMWRQLVYVQIGGLLLATLVTKGVVPLLYVVFVETFKVVEWKPSAPHGDQ